MTDAICLIKNEIINYERIKRNHEKNNDKKNVEYLESRIQSLQKAVTVLEVYEKFSKKEFKITEIIPPTSETK